jgi:hypothetical protein
MWRNYYGNVTSSLAWNPWNRRLAFSYGPVDPRKQGEKWS